MLSDEPPKEFRIFKEGWNSTKKGKFLFDDQAARDVMANYKEHGVDRPIDLEHMSIDSKAPNWDPDARGWFKLALRGGDLWATDVRWSPDGQKRLRDGTQRYISPCFAFDKETKRIAEVINAAICAIPATMETPALIAASLLSGKTFGTLSVEATNMDAMKQILGALGLKEDATPEQCLAAIKALQDDEGGDGEGDGDEVLKALRAKLKLADDASKEDCLKALADDGKDDPPKDEKKDDEKLAALSSAVLTLSKQVATLTQTTEAEKIEKLIADNTDKIPLALEGWAKTQSPKQLVAFLSVMPSNPRAANTKVVADANVVLNKEELEVCAASNTAPELVLAQKKKRIAEAKAKAASSN
jgi:phage I-like protein